VKFFTSGRRIKQLFLAGAGRKASAVMFGAQEKMKPLILNNDLNSGQTYHRKQMLRHESPQRLCAPRRKIEMGDKGCDTNHRRGFAPRAVRERWGKMP